MYKYVMMTNILHDFIMAFISTDYGHIIMVWRLDLYEYTKRSIDCSSAVHIARNKREMTEQCSLLTGNTHAYILRQCYS